MAINQDDFSPDNYAPSYRKETDSFPAPTGLFGRQIANDKSVATQKEEAEKLLTYMESTPRTYDDLASTGLPFPMLIKVPNTHFVRFISGLAPLSKDPFAAPDPMHGELFAILQDIDRADQSAQVIRLPKTALKLQNVMLPTDPQWFEKISKKDDATDGKMWFREAAVKDNTESMAMVCPCLPLWAYDAFTTNVPAHELWERVYTADDTECENVRNYVLNWLKAVHTSHNATNVRKVDIDSRYFMERPGATSTEWVRKRVSTLYPTVGVGSTTTPGTNGQGQIGTNNALAILAQALAGQTNSQTQQGQPQAAVASTTANYDKFGMSDGDVDRMCILCGLKPGQGAGLPQWFAKLNEKGSTKDGQRTLLRKMLGEHLKYEEHPIPCTPAVLDMIIKKAFTGDGDYQTTTGVMKGLSPFLFAPQTAEDIAEATTYARAVAKSTATTVEDLQKLSKKAKAPQTITMLISLLKTFANVLEKLLSPGCPLLIRLVKDAIVPLVQLSPIARQVFSRESIAAIAWAVYHQAMFFAQGDMVGKTPLTSEWVQMTNAVKGGGRSLENYSIPTALANRAPPTSPIKESREAADDDADQDGGAKGKGRKKAKKVKGNEKDTEEGKGPGKRTMEINPIIKAKITPVLPEFLNIKKLCTLCDVEQRNLFGKNICSFAALKGHCPFWKCRSSHDGALVDDELAEKVVNLLQPFLRNPGQLTEG